jgi:hypothetical protein
MAAGADMNKAAELGPSMVPWWQDWRGECAAIIAGGPSAKTAPVELLRDRIHVIAVNESFKLAPWADILYSCDYAWWQLHKGMRDFKGLRLAHDLRACNEFGLQRIVIEQVGSNELLVERPSYVGAGGNSAFQALNLAIQFGATGIILIGVDCSLDHGQHWHGRHPYPMSNPAESNVQRWQKAFDGAAARIAGLGIDVVNCSPISKLTQYPKLSIAEALERWQL